MTRVHAELPPPEAGPRASRLWLAVLAGYALIALACALGWLAPDWQQQRAGSEHRAPGAGAWLGTDQLGRDVLATTLRGAYTAFLVGGLGAGGALLLGAVLGVLTAWRRGPVDLFVLWLSSAVSAIPAVLLILVVAAAMGRGLTALVTAFVLVAWVGVYRVVRAETLRLRERDFVRAAHAAGARPGALVLRHLLPHLAPLLGVQFALGFVGAVQAEAVLSFLGLGLAERASWGRMIAEAWAWDDLGHGRWWRLTAASVALAGLAMSVLLVSRSAGSRRRTRSCCTQVR